MKGTPTMTDAELAAWERELLGGAERGDLLYDPDTDFICPQCGVRFRLTVFQQTQFASRRRRGGTVTGPYCSPRCTGDHARSMRKR